jgi:hypothetical protein
METHPWSHKEQGARKCLFVIDEKTRSSRARTTAGTSINHLTEKPRSSTASAFAPDSHSAFVIIMFPM